MKDAFTKKPLSQKQMKTLQKQQKAKAAAPAPSPPTPSDDTAVKKADGAAAGSNTNGVRQNGTSNPSGTTTADPLSDKKRQMQREQTQAMSAANENFKAGK
eukprot:COSAG02_NODE_2546_length_8564_cov_4.198346_4_plen_101_part_00